VKFAPEYPGGYINYGHLLIDTGEYGKFAGLAEQAMEVKGIDMAMVFRFIAVNKEMSGQYNEAVKYLKRAVKSSMDENLTKFLHGEMKRVKGKMNTFTRFAALF